MQDDRPRTTHLRAIAALGLHVRNHARRSIAALLEKCRHRLNCRWCDLNASGPAKGKTVVLHFWGTWCGPCIATIPVWKRLEEKYSKEEVVFVGIHTAGTKMEDVRAFMKKHQWEHLTGIDRGGSLAESITFRRYGISAVNQIVVLNAEGAVTYNGGKPTQTAGPIEIARQLGVKGPGEEATEKESRDGGIAIMTHMYDKEIEAALRATKAEN